MSFENLNLNSAILKAIAETGYTEPTPIQAQAIPEIMAGHDLMASSQTGSGKTAAFILPALNRLATPSAMPGKGPRVLVLTRHANWRNKSVMPQPSTARTCASRSSAFWEACPTRCRTVCCPARWIFWSPHRAV